MSGLLSALLAATSSPIPGHAKVLNDDTVSPGWLGLGAAHRDHGGSAGRAARARYGDSLGQIRRMKIRTKERLLTIMTLAVIGLIAAIIGWTYMEVDIANRQRQQASA